MVNRILYEICSNCGSKILDEEKAILLDTHNDMIFCDEKCLRENFEGEISELEQEYTSLRSPEDIPTESHAKYSHLLKLVLNEPDEVWEQPTDDDSPPMSFFIGEFLVGNEQIFYVAAAYFAEDKPAFVYMHFPTTDLRLVEKFKVGTLVFDAAEEESRIGDDEINEDHIGYEIYRTMLDLRSDEDIGIEEFESYDHLKLATVDKPEEIWRQIDDTGATFLIYISHHEKNMEPLAYLVVAAEDDLSESAVPLFGFPTLDQKLLEKFRVGECIFKSESDF